MFLLHTDSKGNAAIREHFVYDGDKFFRSQLDEAKKEGGTVTIVDKEDYIKQRKHVKTFK
jgi:hypothetical protein